MPEQPNRHGLAALRATAAFVAAGAVLAGAVLAGAAWPVALSSAWGVAALLILARILLEIGRMDSAQTKAHARTADFSRPFADAVILTASVGSLLAIGYTVETAGNRHGTTKALLILLAFAVVAVSWLTVHTLFVLRYGDLYYAEPVGGIDFSDDEQPDYRDFAYVALTIGMTFQVSDTNLTAKRVRRQATRHALLSFFFVTVILALTINSVASLVG